MTVLRTHRTPLRVVLENRIGNALKHHDRAAGRVTVAMRMADGVAEFHVSDDGPGIKPRFHDRIFATFQTRQVLVTTQHGHATGKSIPRTANAIHHRAIRSGDPCKGKRPAW